VIDKVAANAAAALADVGDGARILVGGFGVVQGWPTSLIAALRARGVRDLTLICNTPGVGPTSPQILADQIGTLIATFAAYPTRPTPVEAAIKAGKIRLELVPQGTLVERVRAGGAGIPAFFTPTAVGTELATGRETRVFDGREYLLERALPVDYAFLRAARADAFGNLQFHGSQRNFNPVMATAARTVIAEVEEEILPRGAMDPDQVHTSGVFVQRLVRIPPPPEGFWPIPPKRADG